MESLLITIESRLNNLKLFISYHSQFKTIDSMKIDNELADGHNKYSDNSFEEFNYNLVNTIEQFDSLY